MAGSRPARKGHGRAHVTGRAGPAQKISTPTTPAPRTNVLVSACLIVKDEQEALPGCLASLSGVADEIVIYDTGSTDATVEVARATGAVVIEGYWDDDFGRARNAALEHCRGEWILWVDADEHFVTEHRRELRALLGRERAVDALLIDIANFGGDGSALAIAHRALRLFRRAVCQWYGALHEQVDLRPGRKGEVRVRPIDGARIDHYGYMDEVVQGRDKSARNLRIAEAAIAAGDARPGQEGMPELNLARSLAAVGRLEEAQHYMDEAVAAAQTGLARRASLFHGTQNLIALGRLEEAVDMAQRFRDACSRQDLAYYLEGMARRRLGQAEAAIALFEKVSQPTNEDSFTYPLFMLRAERAGALLEADRAGEAADELALLVEDNPDVRHITAALKAFAVAGKSIDALVAAMPADRLERVGAALTLVPAEVADQMAEALWARFGPRPQLLAAAIRFAPNLNAARALEWSARVRAIGMAHACPLVARAADPGVPATERVRAAVTAHAAFADQRGAARALDAAPLVATADVGAVLAEVALLGPAILAEWAGAAMGTHGEAGDRDQRRAAIAQGLAKAGHTDLAAQSENAPAALSEDQPLSPQLTGAGADR